MSRLIVKGLPLYYTDDQLRTLLSSRGASITDCRIMKTKEGVSRRFAFVGFREASQAKDVLQWFNKSFVDTSRISVSFARAIGETKDRAWSKYTPGSSRHRKKHPEMYDSQGNLKKEGESGKAEKKMEELQFKKKKALLKEKRSEKLQEFLELMGIGVSTQKNGKKSWANDNADGAADAELALQEAKEKEEIQKKKKEESKREGAEENDMNDLDFLRSKTVSNFDDDKSDENKQLRDNEDVDILETGRLFVRNLPYSATEDNVNDHFEQFGQISDVRLPKDDSNQSKGYGFVTFLFPEDAVRALGSTDGKIFMGRILHVMPAKVKNAEKSDELSENEKKDKKRRETYKAKKEAKLKAEADNEKSWNSLFLRTDTALSKLSKQLNIKKSDILDREAGSSIAVQSALAETQVLVQTKEALVEAGVDLDVLTQAARGNTKNIDAAGTGAQTQLKRSRKVLITKNLPEQTSGAELKKMFSKYGEIERIVFPSPHVLAIVEFEEGSAAKRAFKALAFKRFKHSPLFLEWAPAGIFSQKKKSDAKKDVENENAKRIDDKVNTKMDEKNEIDETTTTLFAKNLNFDTTNDSLLSACKNLGVRGLRSVHVQTKADKKGGRLSMGFGFLEFKNHSKAMNALKKFQGILVDGHALQLKLSDRKSTKRKRNAESETMKKKKTKGTTKMCVRNLAFEATRNDLRELFGAFGTLKSVRLPKKFAGGNRGFAFVEYLSKTDAAAAYEQLSSTHLYGRRLVLEWANNEEGLDELRAKASRDVNAMEYSEEKGLSKPMEWNEEE
eukprot:g3076.t1